MMAVFLYPEPATEPSRCIVGVSAVVIHENMTVPEITKDGAPELSDIRRCLYPARRFRVKLSECLQLTILFLVQNLDAHVSRHTDRTGFWFMFFS